MYVKPRLERFGSFRELTRIGFTEAGDGFGIGSGPEAPGGGGGGGGDTRS